MSKFSHSVSFSVDEGTASLIAKLTAEPAALDDASFSWSKAPGKHKLRALAQTFKGLQQLRDFQNAEGGCHLLPSMGRAGVGTPLTDAAQTAIFGVPNRLTGPVRAHITSAMPFACLVGGCALCTPGEAWKAEIKHAFKFWYNMLALLCIGLCWVMIWVIPGCLLVALLFSFSEYFGHSIALPCACAESVSALSANLPACIRAIVFDNAVVTSVMDNYRGQYSKYVQPVQQSTYTSMIVVNKSDAVLR